MRRSGRNFTASILVIFIGPAAWAAARAGSAIAAARNCRRLVMLLPRVSHPHRRYPHDLAVLLLAAHVIVAGFGSGLGGGIAPGEAHFRLFRLDRVHILVVLYDHYLAECSSSHQLHLERGGLCG